MASVIKNDHYNRKKEEAVKRGSPANRCCYKCVGPMRTVCFMATWFSALALIFVIVNITSMIKRNAICFLGKHSICFNNKPTSV